MLSAPSCSKPIHWKNIRSNGHAVSLERPRLNAGHVRQFLPRNPLTKSNLQSLFDLAELILLRVSNHFFLSWYTVRTRSGNYFFIWVVLRTCVLILIFRNGQFTNAGAVGAVNLPSAAEKSIHPPSQAPRSRCHRLEPVAALELVREILGHPAIPPSARSSGSLLLPSFPANADIPAVIASIPSSGVPPVSTSTTLLSVSEVSDFLSSSLGWRRGPFRITKDAHTRGGC